MAILEHNPNICHFSPTFILTERDNQNTTANRERREEKMEKKVVAVCCVVGFLGLLSAATAFAAEATRIKVFLLLFLIFCIDPSLFLVVDFTVFLKILIYLWCLVHSLCCSLSFLFHLLNLVFDFM